MTLFSADIQDLRSLYITHLRRALDMEQKISSSLPIFVDNSSDPALSAVLRTHLAETKGHILEIQNLLQKHTGTAESEACKVVNGLTTEATDTIKDVTDPDLRNIALIAAAQQVEHHEIAVYGSLRRWASLLGMEADVAVLKVIETEEGNADKLFVRLSERVNLQAAA